MWLQLSISRYLCPFSLGRRVERVAIGCVMHRPSRQPQSHREHSDIKYPHLSVMHVEVSIYLLCGSIYVSICCVDMDFAARRSPAPAPGVTTIVNALFFPVCEARF